jgi:molecular chaperone GrpE
VSSKKIVVEDGSKVNPESTESADRSGNPGADQASEAVAALIAERDQIAAEKAELQDRVLRAQAEFQNFRKRTETQRLEMAEYASTEAVRALVPVLDDFERALKVESSDREFVRGMELIYQRLFESLKKLGLEPIVSAGQPFDPNIHHAVEMVETTEAPDHTVLDEYQRGYNFKGRLLRAAMVKVAVEPKPAA